MSLAPAEEGPAGRMDAAHSDVNRQTRPHRYRVGSAAGGAPRRHGSAHGRVRRRSGSVLAGLGGEDRGVAARRIGGTTRRLRWLRRYGCRRWRVRCRCESRRVAVEVTPFCAGHREGT